MTPKRQMREKNLLGGGYFLTLNCVFWAIACEIISIRLAYVGAQVEKGRMEEKSQEVYISRVRRATSGGRIPTKLGKCVRLTDVINHAKFHRYNLRGFGAVRCWSFHFAIREAVLNTLLYATVQQVINIITTTYSSQACSQLRNDSTWKPVNGISDLDPSTNAPSFHNINFTYVYPISRPTAWFERTTFQKSSPFSFRR